MLQRDDGLGITNLATGDHVHGLVERKNHDLSVLSFCCDTATPVSALVMIHFA